MTLAEGAGFVVADLALWGIAFLWVRWLIRKGGAEYRRIISEEGEGNGGRQGAQAEARPDPVVQADGGGAQARPGRRGGALQPGQVPADTRPAPTDPDGWRR
jgi:hypothetical protein